MELAINPSKIISPLCYSIFRLEPYTSCSFSCSYCYARWYRGEELRPNLKSLGMFSKVARKLDLRIAFRLSTLSDPLQEAEEKFKLSLKMLRIAEKHEIPIILNTKSDRIAKNPWKKQINEMAKNDLVVVQVSIFTLEKNPFEKSAPDPKDRLEALQLVEAPKILRLQPFLPNYSFKDPSDFVEKVSDYGIDQITVEMLRIERSELNVYGRFWKKWSEYSFEGDLIKAESREVLEELSMCCKKRGIDFGLCKEGFFDLETANCCGLHYLNAEIRPTLREVYRALLKRKVVPLDRVDEIFEEYLFGEKLQSLPRPIRKALKYHEKTLLRCLRNKSVVERLTPLIKLDDGKLRLAADDFSAIYQKAYK